jgi:6-phosphogluconolactonase
MRMETRTWWLLLLALIGSIFLSACNTTPKCTSSASSSATGTGSAPGGQGEPSGSPSCGTTEQSSGGGTTTPTTTALLYYFGSSNIQAASLNSAGTFANLSAFTPPTLPTSTINSMIVVNEDFLYVPTGISQIEGYTIDQTSGALTAITGSPFAAQSEDDTVTTDPKGQFLFVGGRFSSLVSAYQINPSTGALTPAPGSPFQSFNVVFANSLTVDSTGSFLYVGQTFSTNPVAVFAINATTGALSEVSGSPFPLGVAVLQANPAAGYLFGIADDTGTSGDQHIHVFSINPNSGAPTAVANSPFPTVSTPFALTVPPSGSFVYPSVDDSSDDVTSLEGYVFDSTTGALSAIAGSPFTTIPPVADCQFEQTGAFAFCNNATGFSILSVNTNTGVPSATIPALVTSTNLPFAATD